MTPLSPMPTDSPETPQPKPCPFCGEMPATRHDRQGKLEIRCASRNCTIAVYTPWFINAMTDAEVIESWNRRSTPEAPTPTPPATPFTGVKTVEALREKVAWLATDSYDGALLDEIRAAPSVSATTPICDARSPIGSRCILPEKHWTGKDTMHTDGESCWRCRALNELPPFPAALDRERNGTILLGELRARDRDSGEQSTAPALEQSAVRSASIGGPSVPPCPAPSPAIAPESPTP